MIDIVDTAAQLGSVTMTYLSTLLLVLLTLPKTYGLLQKRITLCVSKSTLKSQRSAIDQLAFLSKPDQSLYISSILRRSTESCNQCLKDGHMLIEVEFPANRKSDLSVTETLDTNRRFVRDFVAGFSALGKDLVSSKRHLHKILFN